MPGVSRRRGRKFGGSLGHWLEQGLRPSVAKALIKAGYLTLADLAGK
ncbi:MAG: hypothetical protein ACJ76J_30685 [Thermoanaerobaculia bacterium]